MAGDGQAGGIGALDAAPPATNGLQVVPCHFEVINGDAPAAVTDSLDSRPMGASGGHAATRVLVVDDDRSIRLVCRANLELEGHEVLEAHSLRTARATLDKEDVAVVVLDVHLHGERSDPLVTECHTRPRPIPVVLVTGSVELTDPRLREADAVLPKPFELDQLLSTVRDLAESPRDR